MENPVISREYIRKNYIHKDKIIKTIQEIEELLKQIDYHNIKDKEERQFYKNQYMQYITARNILKGLLEETEDENNNTFTMQKQEEQSTDFNKQ